VLLDHQARDDLDLVSRQVSGRYGIWRSAEAIGLDCYFANRMTAVGLVLPQYSAVESW
jgi:hypothetical protein